MVGSVALAEFQCMSLECHMTVVVVVVVVVGWGPFLKGEYNGECDTLFRGFPWLWLVQLLFSEFQCLSLESVIW